MRHIGFLVIGITMITLWGCGKVETITSLDNPKNGNHDVEIVTAWIPDKLTNENPMLNMGVYKNELFYVTLKNDTFVVIFTDINGIKKRELTIKKGKGPGELVSPSQCYIRNDTIYFYEMNRLLLSIFDLNGKLIDDVQFDEKTALPFFTEVNGKTLYFNDPLKYRIAAMDITNSSALTLKNTVPYENTYASLEEVFKGKPRIVIPQYDTLSNSLFVTQTDNGFSVSRFSSDLELQQEIVKISGSIINIGSYIDTKYLYVPEVIDFEKLQKTQKSEIDFRIAVIDKMKGTHIKSLTSKKIPTVKGMLTILGEIDGNLIINIMFFQPDKSLGEFATIESMKNVESEQWMLVIKKPSL